MPCNGKPDGTVETLGERYAREVAADQSNARQSFNDFVTDNDPDISGLFKLWEVEVVIERLMAEFKAKGYDVGDEYAEAAEVTAVARRLMKRPPMID